MAWVDGKWIDEKDSVSGNLTGLLSANSDYIKQARSQGEKAAGRRGLLNSSIAAGSGQSAAISAALPIASQDASIAAGKNAAQAEFTSQTKLNEQSITGQKDLATLNNAAEAARQKEQQERDNVAQMDRLNTSISASDRQALLAAETNLKTASIQSADNLGSNYLQALGQSMANEKIPASTRRQLIAEYQRVTQQSTTLRNNLAQVNVSW
jgi:hypothetical protein